MYCDLLSEQVLHEYWVLLEEFERSVCVSSLELFIVFITCSKKYALIVKNQNHKANDNPNDFPQELQLLYLLLKKTVQDLFFILF